MLLPPPHRGASIIYNLLIRMVRVETWRYVGRWWWRAWRANQRLFKTPIATTIHNQRVIVNNGYTYPFYSRKFPALNNPLVELAYQAFRSTQRPITLIDVGAAVGDTVLLVEANCPAMVERYHCIDGDAEFFDYLRHNVRTIPKIALTLAQLSADRGVGSALVRTHAGTASAQGPQTAPTMPLDDILLAANYANIDVLKIDVDGFDGNVLKGAQHTLSTYHPAVIFEWHPLLCQTTGNSWHEHYEVLVACGYTTFLWFSKYGDWQFTMRDYSAATIDAMADLCLQSRVYPDWHYDVVALHGHSLVDSIALAETTFAKSRPSRA